MKCQERRYAAVMMVALGAGYLAGNAALAQNSPPSAQAAARELLLNVGRSQTLAAPWAVKRVSVTDPKIADVQVLTPTQVLVSGKASGATDLFLWSADEQLWQARVVVQIDRAGLSDELNRYFPAAHLQLRQLNDSLLVSGQLQRAEEAEQLHRILTTHGSKFVDLTTLPGVQQVQIKVVIAEANRTAIRALGINAFIAGSSAFGGSTIGPESGGPINPINIGATGGTAVGGRSFSFLSPSDVSPGVTIFGGVPGSDLQFFISALAENQYMRVLAEPSLVALSGRDASFLAGGEFPIPVVQGAGSANSGTSISIEYKEFGVRLKFRPTVLGNNQIRLYVAPEVSQLSSGPGSVQIQGFSIPAILTRRAETTLELRSGQTFGMAGLINQTVEARNSRVPGLGDIPILGSLFRSVRYKAGDTELVVLVSASLVEPLSIAHTPPLPGMLHVQPNDWELFGNGQIEGGVPPKIAPIDAEYLREMGLTRLRGPGAWATYEDQGRPSAAPLRGQ